MLNGKLWLQDIRDSYVADGKGNYPESHAVFKSAIFLAAVRRRFCCEFLLYLSVTRVHFMIRTDWLTYSNSAIAEKTIEDAMGEIRI